MPWVNLRVKKGNCLYLTEEKRCISKHINKKIPPNNFLNKLKIFIYEKSFIS